MSVYSVRVFLSLPALADVLAPPTCPIGPLGCGVLCILPPPSSRRGGVVSSLEGIPLANTHYLLSERGGKGTKPGRATGDQDEKQEKDRSRSVAWAVSASIYAR